MLSITEGLNAHSAATLALTGLALFLFSKDRIPLETSSLVILAILTAGFEIFPYETGGVHLNATHFFSGFGHEALIAVVALMVAGQGLIRTGALEPIGNRLAQLWTWSPKLSLLATLLVGATASAFVNNTPIVVLLLPILVSVSMKTGKPSSSMLMPMGFATLLGGMATTIGTSTNLLVVSVAHDLGLRKIEMFDFAGLAAIAGSVGIVYLWLVAPKLLPDRTPMMSDISPRIFNARLHIQEGSIADGASLSAVIKATSGSLNVSKVLRDKNLTIMPLPDMTLRAGDILLARDRPDKLKEYERTLGAILYSGDSPMGDIPTFEEENQQVAEIVIPHGSPLVGATLQDTRILDEYKLTAVALSHAGAYTATYFERFIDKILRIGDVVLVQGEKENIAALRKSPEFMVLDATLDIPRTSKATLAFGIMVAIVVVASVGVLPIAVSAMLGALLMIVTKCINWDDATHAISTQIIFVVVTSLALGKALLVTGGAEYVANGFVAVAGSLPPQAMLSALMLVMAIMTNVVSNNAAAVIGVPIAISIASQVGAPPEPFVMAVLFGANMSYATPMAYKTNLLVMNSGGYKFADFVRVGAPLTLLLWGVFSLLLPWWYGL